MSKNKGITNIHELREIKSRLLLERMELENKMYSDWNQMKENFRPRNMLKNLIASATRNENDTENDGLQETIGGIFIKAGNRIIRETSRKLFKWMN